MSTIAATNRAEFGRRASAAYRKNGQVPAVIMRGGDESLHILVGENEAEKAISSGSHTFDLTLEGAGKTVLLREYSRDCITDRLEHVDLMEVSPDTVVKVSVPVVANTMNCPGIKAGGMLEQMVRKITIKCAVKDIPDNITVSLEGVGIAETIYAENVTPPEGVAFVTKGRLALMTVLKTRAMKKAEAASDGGEEG